MSADNGIYILCLKDDFRVIHAQAIDNLWWSMETMNETDKINPIEVISYFKNARVFDNMPDAMNYAVKLYEEHSIVEYGICPIDDLHEFTWEQILQQAKEIAKIEIDAITKNNNDGRWDNDIEYRKKLIAGEA